MSGTLADQVAAIGVEIGQIQAEIGVANPVTLLTDLTNLDATAVSLQLQLNPLTDPTGALTTELDADIANIATLQLSICYLHGTHILTERGEIAVENLVVGDRVITPHGPEASTPIRWIGKQHFEGDAARFTQPVVVRAGALGDGLPHRDLRVSSDHCLHLDGRLVPAKLLVNGKTIVFEKGLEVLDYVNIEIDRHSVIFAEGIESETYLDCGNRFRFDNAHEGADWIASRVVGSDAAWHDGRAFAQPLWDGPELTTLVERIVEIGERDSELAKAA